MSAPLPLERRNRRSRIDHRPFATAIQIRIIYILTCMYTRKSFAVYLLNDQLALGSMSLTPGSSKPLTIATKR